MTQQTELVETELRLLDELVRRHVERMRGKYPNLLIAAGVSWDVQDRSDVVDNNHYD